VSLKSIGSQKQILDKKDQQKYKKSYTSCDIIFEMHSDHINKKVAKLSGNAKLGCADWIKHYPTVISYVILKLSRKNSLRVSKLLMSGKQSGHLMM
jgi:hypothetical protein